MNKITKEWLSGQRACGEGLRWFIAQSESNTKKVLFKLVEENHADWANWTIIRIMNKEQKVRYAIFAAEQVLSIFETKYPDDTRPREAIKAAISYINGGKSRYATAAAAAYAACLCCEKRYTNKDC